MGEILEHFNQHFVAHLYFVDGCNTFGWMMMFGKDLGKTRFAGKVIQGECEPLGGSTPNQHDL